MKQLSPLTWSSLAGYSLLLAFSAGLIHWQGRLGGVLRFPGWEETGRNVLVGLLLATAVLSGSAALAGTFRWARQLEAEFRILLGPLSVPDAVVLAVASAIAEETFFRAILQPAVGLVPASLVFGLLHYPVNRRLVPWTILAVLMGFVFGAVFEVTGSLLAVALAHGLINFFELLSLARKARMPRVP